MNRILVDAGFLVAVFDRGEPRHSECVGIYGERTEQLVTCEAAIAEAAYLLRNVHGAPQAILENIDKGILEIPFVLADAAGEVADIMRKYADTPCDLADACLIALADLLGTGDILTLDGDFRHYRWRRNRRFRMLIPLG